MAGRPLLGDKRLTPAERQARRRQRLNEAQAASSGFQTGEPPQRSDRQYIALTIENPGDRPVWRIIQWCSWPFPGKRKWAWRMSFGATALTVIRWAELPEMDHYGQYTADNMDQPS